MEPSPSSGPSESLGLQLSTLKSSVPQTEISGSLAQIQEGPAVFSNVSDSTAGVDLPLAECAQLSLNDHPFNIILKIN